MASVVDELIAALNASKQAAEALGTCIEADTLATGERVAASGRGEEHRRHGYGRRRSVRVGDQIGS